MSAPWIKVSEGLPDMFELYPGGPVESVQVLVRLHLGGFKVATCSAWPQEPLLWHERTEYRDITGSVTHWQYITPPEGS